MKMFTTMGYTYSELTAEAKEKVKQWYLNTMDIHNDIFYDDIRIYLSEQFPSSDLKVCYRLSSCQGDGLNIHGDIKLYDFLDKWEQDEKTKRTMTYYIDNSLQRYTFERNERYCYSCKFIDKKYIQDTINEFIEELQHQQLSGIKNDVIETFFVDMLNYFENLDSEFEKDGYNYLYNVDDEEMQEFCEINDYYFTENGKCI